MKRFLIILLPFIFSSVLQAQIIEVTEVTNNSAKAIPLGKYSIVDINSKLKLSLNTDSLNTKISRVSKTNTVLLSQLDELNFILENQIEILNILEDSCKETSERKSIKQLVDYSVLMNLFYERLLKNEKLTQKVNALFDEYFQKRSGLDRTVYPNPQAYVIKNLAVNAQAVLNQIQQSDETKKVNIQLVAFLDTKAKQNQKVHIINFDNYADGEFYEVERWVTSFSDDEIKAFNRTSNLADDLNKVVTNGFEGLNEVLNKKVSSYRCVNDIMQQIKTLRVEADSIFDGNEEAATQFLKELESELNALVKILDQIIQPPKGTNELEDFDQFSNEFIAKVNVLPTEFDSLFKLFTAKLEEVNEPVIALKDSVDNCMKYLKQDAERIKELSNYVSNIIKPFKNSADSAQIIGDEVLNFSIGQLPAFGIIDLKNTGMRENGAKLELQVLFKNTANKSINEKPVVVEFKTITLQQVNVYSESKVSLILASPYNSSEKVTLDNRFQFAPSGSLLFKFGSRKSPTWNYLEPGLGFNMSTPDFDLNGTPDVALGAVFSVLNDVVMLGWSYNINTDSPFWFFGLSLPFSIPGAPINSVATNSNTH